MFMSSGGTLTLTLDLKCEKEIAFIAFFHPI